MRAARGLLAIFVAAWLAGSAGSAFARGQSALQLFPEDQILRVRISPTGEWIVATATTGRYSGVLAQRFGTHEIVTVHSALRGVGSMEWVGRDTLLVRLNPRRDQLLLRVDFRRTETGELAFEKRLFQAAGWLADPLPLRDGILAWAYEREGQSVVRLVSLDELAPLDGEGLAVADPARLGRRVAAVDGSVERWLVDREGNPLAALRRDESGLTFLYRASPAEPFEELASFEPGGDALLNPFGFTSDGRNLIVTAYDGKPTIGLFEYDPRARSLVREIYRREDVDIDTVVFDPVTRDVLSVRFSRGSATRYHYLEESRAIFGPRLGAADPPIESILVVGSDATRDRFIYWTQGPTEPGAHYLRRASVDETALLGRKGEKIDRARLRPLESFFVDSTDGLRIEALLTIPRGSPDGGHPLVVMPHGGPMGVHDKQQYDPIVQYLASWGFAVLQANYRGSTGYGEDFVEAGMKQWARGIEDDIDAAVVATLARPDIDANAVCIIGGSYGGFSAIASALRHPERFRCSVTINGVSDVPLLTETSDYADSRAALEHFKKAVGDYETERDELVRISPAYHLEGLRTPTLVVYGDRDVRVDPDHAHRLVAMLQLYGKEYQEIRVKDGRHSFTREQWGGLLPEVRRFLTRHLMPDRRFQREPQ